MQFHFGDYVLDVERRELRRGIELISVEPQVFDLLAYLVRNRDRVVSKDDLLAAVWGGRIVSESTLTSRINAVRKAVGDSGDEQRLIRTFARKGVRFVGEASEATSGMSAAGMSRACHVPAPATALVGREREVVYLKDLLTRSDVRLVTLTGAGGTGKTRLALQVARELAGFFADGVWFVDLAPLRDAAFVVSTVARALGIQETADRPLSDSLRGHLRTRKLLLLLDNFEQILPAGALVADLLAACPALKILVTSRAVLRLSGEHDVAVPPLSLPDPARDATSDAESLLHSSEAVQLFVARSKAVHPGLPLTVENALAIGDICVRLDGLPLAIELAAARVRVLAPPALRARLTRGLPVLTGGARDLPARQQTLRNTIQWSHELLGAREKQLFRRLAVFGGGFTCDAVEAICHETGGVADVLDALESLLDMSLTQRHDVAGGESRFSMLETIREFAAEQLEESGEASAFRRRHAEHFLAFAETADPELRGARQTEWLARLEREHDNLRAALTWGLGDGGDPELGVRLAGTLWWFWGVHGHLSEGRRWANQARELPASLAPATRAGILRGTALFAVLQGEYVRAIQFADEACVLFQQLRRHVEAAMMQGVAAIAHQYRGDLQQARTLLEHALRIVREADDPWCVAWILRNLGRVAHDDDDEAAAARFLEESLALTRRIGDTRSIALSLHYLGVVGLELGWNQSSEYLRESVDLFRQINDRRGLAWALHYLAVAALARGRSQDAQAFETESLSLRKDLGDKRGVAECLEGQAARLTAEGRPRQAIRLFATAAALREAIGAPGPPADQRRVRRSLEVARAAVDPAAAADAWSRGLAEPLEDVLTPASGESA